MSYEFDKQLGPIAAAVLDGATGTLDREARNHLHTQTDDDRSATLFKLLQPAIGKALSDRSLQKIDAITKRYAEFLGRHGIAFPQLRAVIFERRGHIELVRADLDDAGIQVVVSNAVVRWPDIDPRELADAIRNSFPDYRGVAQQMEWEAFKRDKEAAKGSA